MFSPQTYKERRRVLKESMSDGIGLFWTNDESPMNYAANGYRYRQDSTFLYFFGLDQPGLTAIIDFNSGAEILFGDDPALDDIIWIGPQISLKQKAENIMITDVRPVNQLQSYLSEVIKDKRTIHFVPPYRHEHRYKLNKILDISAQETDKKASTEMVKAIVKQRSFKSKRELEEITKAHDITREMHVTAMQMAQPGLLESDIAGKIEGMALARGTGVSFPVIFTIHGETLHNHYHGNLLEEGRLIINDSGAETAMHYAADITRTFPVTGRFTPEQKDIYQIVLQSQLSAMEQLKPGVVFKDVHKHAARNIVDGLKNVGLMKGDSTDAVERGAHALFFPHGLGHMMGLDVHDMENYGEQYVGYDDETTRSEQFGLAALRFGKRVQENFVLTIEPGIYFIPTLIDLWQKDNKFSDYINYEKVTAFRNFGGVRIEDDVVINDSGCEVLGKPIPKTVQEIEEMCAQ
ncbi:MAG: M24 family metallopeptidase [Caldithrix sp.]|nr:M24 family metallopeptidase [Caldithrix sp.]